MFNKNSELSVQQIQDMMRSIYKFDEDVLKLFLGKNNFNYFYLNLFHARFSYAF